MDLFLQGHSGCVVMERWGGGGQRPEQRGVRGGYSTAGVMLEVMVAWMREVVSSERGGILSMTARVRVRTHTRKCFLLTRAHSKIWKVY